MSLWLPLRAKLLSYGISKTKILGISDAFRFQTFAFFDILPLRSPIYGAHKNDQQIIPPFPPSTKMNNRSIG